MTTALRRPIRPYLIHVFWITLVTYQFLSRTSEAARWANGVLASCVLLSLVYLLIRRNYLEVQGNRLLINKSYFRTVSVELDKIDKFEIDPSPFYSSKIILKDKSIIKYSDSQVDDKELRKFMSQFNIPVE